LCVLVTGAFAVVVALAVVDDEPEALEPDPHAARPSNSEPVTTGRRMWRTRMSGKLRSGCWYQQGRLYPWKVARTR
jgi:hypothetical protein